MGKKQDLQKAEKELEVLVKHTNTKIVELGKYDYSLYVALVNIQERFDRIRNTPTEKQLEYQNIKKVSSTWKEQVDIITKDYESAKNVDKNIAKAGTTLGVGVATLGPTAAMGFATTFGVASTGTAISALSGAAASNAAVPPNRISASSGCAPIAKTLIFFLLNIIGNIPNYIYNYILQSFTKKINAYIYTKRVK